MNNFAVDRVRAAVHQFLEYAAWSGRDTKEYRDRYSAIMSRVKMVEKSGRTKKARRWRKELKEVKPIYKEPVE